VREETEWVELVEAGVNVLSGADEKRIVDSFAKFKDKSVEAQALYGNGNSSDQIISVLAKEKIKRS
jgi:UDP-GlcNAc3NAcA epimerase